MYTLKTWATLDSKPVALTGLTQEKVCKAAVALGYPRMQIICEWDMFTIDLKTRDGSIRTRSTVKTQGSRCIAMMDYIQALSTEDLVIPTDEWELEPLKANTPDPASHHIHTPRRIK